MADAYREFVRARKAQTSPQRKATDEEITAWAERHDLGISSLTDLRDAFEDAQTLISGSSIDGVPAAQGEKR